jgi:hypothetical protein
MHRSCILFVSILLFLLLPLAHAQEKQLNIDAIIEGIEQAPQKIQSARIKFKMVTIKDEDWANMHRDAHDQPQSLTETTIVDWAFKGDKWYNKSAAPDDVQLQNTEQRADAKNHRVNTMIFNGKDNHELHAVVSKLGSPHLTDYMGGDTTALWSPMEIGYYSYGLNHIRWIIDKLRQGSYTLNSTEEDKQFGTLYILSWKNDQDEKARFWIAPKYDFMAVRMETVSAKFKDGNRGMARFKCFSARQIDGIWVPVEGVKETYNLMGNSEQLILKREYKEAQYELNNVDDSLFNPQLPPGAWYVDKHTQKMYRIGASGEKILDERSSMESSDLPLRWLFIASITSLLLMAAGAVIRWRRKRATT